MRRQEAPSERSPTAFSASSWLSTRITSAAIPSTCCANPLALISRACIASYRWASSTATGVSECSPLRSPSPNALDSLLMASWPRCGAPTAGAVCAACGEALAFARPSALADQVPAQVALAPGEGGGWLIASGIIQILLGAFWVVAGIGFAAMAQSGDLMEKLNIPNKVPNLGAFFLLIFTGGGIATIVISSFVISRRRWAWIVSLVFDGLWGLYGVVPLLLTPLGGVICLAISVSLILFLVAGRAALR